MRRRSIKNASTKLEVYNECLVRNPKDYYNKWHELFGNKNPLYIEIGTGKGKFIVEQALKNPNINYLGIEKYESIILSAARKVHDSGVKNLFLLNVDAEKLTEYFSENEVDLIYLNFSDPWPKKRHSKRRLTSDRFINIYKQILKTQGFIEFKSDNRLLFEYSVTSFSKHKYEIIDISLDLHNIENIHKEEIITTEYEEKFKALGNPIYYLKVKVYDE